MLNIRHIALLACLSAPLAMAAGEGVGHPPTGEHMVPPPEAAFKACEGKQVGDRASFSHADGKSVSGICRSVEGKLAVTDLKGYARELALDGARFDRCLDSGEKAKVVETNRKAGEKVGVTGTPAFFVNGFQLTGAQPFEEFKSIIDSELAAVAKK